MPDQAQQPNNALTTREWVALGVLIIAGFGIALVATISLLLGTQVTTDQNRFLVLTVFNTLIPLFGTWVGTVIAFYFSRENFSAAAQSTRELIQQFGDDRLRQTPVDRAWTPASAIRGVTLSQGQSDANVTVQQLQGLLTDTVTRVPVFENTGAIRYVIHQSMIYKFIADNRGLRITEAGAERDATLADFLGRPDLRTMVTKIAIVAKNTTLADAKAAMASVDGCQDVFVTATGQRTEQVVGWITNVDIATYSRA
jgi:hypothetical protein